MFKKFNHKTKNRLLLIGAVLAAFLAYRLAIKKTLIQYKDYKNVNHQIDFAKDIPRKTAELKMQIVSMDKTLQTMQQGETNVQQALIGVVTNYCRENNVVLKEFPETIQTTGSDFLVQTNTFKIEGPFIKLLKLLYILEQKENWEKLHRYSFLLKWILKQNSLN